MALSKSKSINKVMRKEIICAYAKEAFNLHGHTEFIVPELDSKRLFYDILTNIILVQDRCKRIQSPDRELDKSYFSGYLTNFGFAHLMSIYQSKHVVLSWINCILDLIQPIFNCEGPYFLNKDSLPYTKRYSSHHEDFLTSTLKHFRVLIIMMRSPVVSRSIKLIPWSEGTPIVISTQPNMVILFDPQKYYYVFEKYHGEQSEEYCVIPMSVTDAYLIPKSNIMNKERYITSRLSCFGSRRTSKSLAFPLSQRAIYASLVNVYQDKYLHHNKYSQSLPILCKERDINYWFDDVKWNLELSCLTNIRFPTVEDSESISDLEAPLSPISEEEQEEQTHPTTEDGSSSD
jgi:hypothetical protein